jgi:hypothetical protein
MTDEILKEFAHKLQNLCKKHNLSFSNSKVLRITDGSPIPEQGLPPELLAKYPEAIRELLDLCQQYHVQLPSEVFLRPHEEGTNWVQFSISEGRTNREGQTNREGWNKNVIRMVCDQGGDIMVELRPKD